MTLAEALAATAWLLDCRATCLAELNAELADAMSAPVPSLESVRKLRARIERVRAWVPRVGAEVMP